MTNPNRSTVDRHLIRGKQTNFFSRLSLIYWLVDNSAQWLTFWATIYRRTNQGIAPVRKMYITSKHKSALDM